MLKQNLFRDRSVVKKTIMACSITTSDLIYEIEPEDELVTSELALSAKKVIVYVKQPARFDLLRAQYQNASNIEIRAADFLQVEIQDWVYKIFSNITASMPTQIIRWLLYAKPAPVESFLITAEDTANRYTGTPKETETAILAKPWFDITVSRKFRRTDFDPLPAVDIVLLDIKARKRSLVSPENTNIYRNFIKFSFEAGKKGLDSGYKNIFTEEQWKRITKDLDVKLGIKPTDLTFEQWIHLFEYFVKFIPDSKRMPLLKKK
jgi:23S rRNA (adenine-N6)-dimethyltransferase